MIRVLFDQGVPNRLRRHLSGCQVESTQQRGWGTLKNGELLRELGAGGFHVFVTADKNIPYQQNLASLSFAIVILGTNLWPVIARDPSGVASAIDAARPGSVVLVDFPLPPRKPPAPRP